MAFFKGAGEEDTPGSSPEGEIATHTDVCSLPPRMGKQTPTFQVFLDL